MARFFDRVVNISIDIKAKTGPKLKDFKDSLETGPGDNAQLVALAEEIKDFAHKFPTIGY